MEVSGSCLDCADHIHDRLFRSCPPALLLLHPRHRVVSRGSSDHDKLLFLPGSQSRPTRYVRLTFWVLFHCCHRGDRGLEGGSVGIQRERRWRILGAWDIWRGARRAGLSCDACGDIEGLVINGGMEVMSRGKREWSLPHNLAAPDFHGSTRPSCQ